MDVDPVVEMKRDRIVIAVDIEMTGSIKGCSVIAIGAAFCRESGRNGINGTFLSCCYNPTVALFEKRCVDEFWSKGNTPAILDRIEAESVKPDGSITTPLESIAAFQKWKAGVETYAKERDLKTVVVTDNASYDIANLNILLMEIGFLPMPYKARDGQPYGKVLDSSDFRRGVIATQNGKPSIKDLAEKFDVPLVDFGKEHTHMPDDDATTIAEDYVNTLAVADAIVIHGVSASVAGGHKKAKTGNVVTAEE